MRDRPGEVFGQDRIALVLHGRRTLLARAEIFLRLQHFGGAANGGTFRRQPVRLRRGR